jgi:hypothetical protein
MVPRRALPLLLLVFLAACKSLTPAPYSRDQRPSAKDLLAAAAPRIAAIQVPSAKIRADRMARGGLSLIAQAPRRFRGRVHAKGNELATLAFHEHGYALRYLMDALPQGFYSGPPSDCAVEALIGAPFPLDGLVALVLGGGPLIAAPREIVDQHWNKRSARETLVLASDKLEEELYFAAHEGTWSFSGASLWQRQGGRRGPWLWTVEHLDLHSVNGAVLPARTRISTPGRRRDFVVVITYGTQNTDPEFARADADTGDDATEGEDDDWEDDEGWEDGAPEAGKESSPTTREPPAKTKPAEKPAVPAHFILSPAGLTPRGDLCRP